MLHYGKSPHSSRLLAGFVFLNVRVKMPEYQIQYSDCKQKLWVHKNTGETVARFDVRFGMDIHNSIELQEKGAPQCLHCTHQAASADDFNVFCEKVYQIFRVKIDKSLIALSNAKASLL